MEDFKQECIDKSDTINKYRIIISELQRMLNVRNIEIKILIAQRNHSDEQLNPVKNSLNMMTAAHGKLLRKLAREKNRI